MQIPSPEEGGIIKKDWFDIIDPHILSKVTVIDNCCCME
jgi:hypothetical protein